MQDDDADKYRAPALDKGLDILELLAQTESSKSQAEIAKALGRSPNEIYRMLDRLVRRDYVRRTEEDRYELTLKLFELAHTKPPIRRLVSQATPILRSFALESEQACHLVIHDRNILVVVAQVDAPGYWSVSVRVGSRIGLVNTGSGHVFLAFASPEEQQSMLDEQAKTSDHQVPADFDARLKKVHSLGFESMPSQQVLGITNISAPVFGPLGTVIAVLTCPYTQRLDRTDIASIDETRDLLIAASEEISHISDAAYASIQS